ncbi:hypothetical protein [Bordetella muralis]|uniref:hypothetical protein n=1 Tax=Bordetella muralis TaxID=1649130 RepID=UPI0039EE8A18
MGHLITSVAATERNYPWDGDFSMPQLSYTDGLVGLYVLGLSDSMSCRNFANPALPLLVVGSPDYSTDGAGVGPGAYFDTQLPGTPDMTLVAVVQKINGSAAPVISNLTLAQDVGTPYARGDTMFASIQDGILSTRVFRDQGGANAGPLTGLYVARGLPGGWATIGGLFNGSNNSGSSVIGQGGASAAVNNAATGEARLTFNNTLRIGSVISSSSTQGSCRVRMVAIYNTIPPSGGLTALVDGIRTGFGPSVGLTDL